MSKPVLLIASFAVLSLSLLTSSPPGSAPDEYAHYLKAAAAGRGDLILERHPPPLAAPGESGTREAWMDTQDRLVTLPHRLAPEPFLCWAQPYYVGTCGKVGGDSGRPEDFSTYVGRYPPYGYVVPGLLMRLSTRPIPALYLGRLGSLLASMVLLAAATFALYDAADRSSLTGLIAAVTPMVLYVLATLSSSGIEVTSGICFFACLLRLSRPDAGRPRWVWTAAGISGATLAVVRDLGPLWVALTGALAVGASGVAPWLALLRAKRSRALIAGAAVLLGVVLGVAWQATQGPASPPPELTSAGIRSAIELLPYMTRQAIGLFGPLDTPLPPLGVLLASVALVSLLGAGFAAGDGRQRAFLGASLAALVVLAGLAQAIQHESGFRAQARHMLPFAVAVPMLAGEIVYRSSSWAARIKIPLLRTVAVCLAGAHVIAWHTIARRFAVGLGGPMLFVEQAQWRPVLGWPLWAGATGCGTLLLLAFALRRGKAA